MCVCVRRVIANRHSRIQLEIKQVRAARRIITRYFIFLLSTAREACLPCDGSLLQKMAPIRWARSGPVLGICVATVFVFAAHHESARSLGLSAPLRLDR